LFICEAKFNIRFNMKFKVTLVIITATVLLSSFVTGQSKSQQKLCSVKSSCNPILPGDFADPCILQYKDTFYVYATAWDSKDAIVWYSANFVDWKMRKLNWPTTKLSDVIWAPCVVKGKDSRFNIYCVL